MEKKLRFCKIAIVFLSLIVTGLVFALGVSAITNAQKVQFNLSTQYAPEVYVGVDMKVDGAYKQIFSSQNPAEVNYTAYYIESVSNNTINLKNENLFISANAVQLKFYNYDTRYKINCYINNSGSPISLAKPTSSSAPTTIEHSVSVGENQLGIVLISLRFEALEEITISFNSGEGSACSDITFAVGENAVLPTPTRDGYEFQGWFTDESYTTQVTSTTDLTQNTTLYAKWEEAEYTLNITVDGDWVNGPAIFNTLITTNENVNVAYNDGSDDSDPVLTNNEDSESSPFPSATFSMGIEPDNTILIYTTSGYSGHYLKILSYSFTNNQGNAVTISVSNITTSVSSTIRAIKFKMPAQDINLTISAKSDLVCFVAGTEVLTYDGYKNIEDIQTGDKVLTINEETKEYEWKEVLYPTKTWTSIQTTTIIVNSEEITATSGHTFYVKNGNEYIWKKIGELTTEDYLVAYENGAEVLYQITSTTSEMFEGFVYNMHIDGNHNFMVSKNNLVVHNVDGPPGACA